MKKEQKQEPINIGLNINNALPTLWVDGINVSVRKDDICLLRFFSTLPEGSFEQTKVMTSTHHLKAFADILCSSLDYFPQKPDKKI